MSEDDVWRDHLEPAGPGLHRIRRHGDMLVDAMLVGDSDHIHRHGEDKSPNQLVNTACLPGVVGQAWAMADWHFGYGFPIGGVVATDIEAGGVISPGGVGFDINCGVRLCALDLVQSDLKDMKKLGRRLKGRIPAGPSGKGGVDLSPMMMDSILSGGAKAAIEHGWGEDRDLAAMESNGQLETYERNLSERALKRGELSLGTLGSGNHFLELQVVDQIVDQDAARAFGLREGQVTAMIHTGSRGLGHQVCSDHVGALENHYKSRGRNWYAEKWDMVIPDRQLAAAPFHSAEGQAYFEAMQSAGNYAFANRSALTQRLRDTLRAHLGTDGDLEVVYDVCHNIAKVEDHVIHGISCSCCVHRKGATRALGGDHQELSPRFAGIGQPVLVPGDMGTASWVLAGPKSGSNQAFDSSCHGAGRALSRSQARRTIDGVKLQEKLEQQGITVHANTPNVLSEEAPEAYKDVDEVIRLTAEAELARPVARLRPFCVIKG
ncbi:MAG: RtcB family protein [Candidatus Thalassarchaeaceae archaeon]|nr:RtcB family protein [Candidatus Thalassarchaeaceae archaeon]